MFRLIIGEHPDVGGDSGVVEEVVGRSRYAAEKKFKSGYTSKFAQFRANKQGRIP